MSFDKKKVLSEIQSILEGINVPGTTNSVVKSRCIQRIIAHEGEVSIVLSFPAETAPHKAALKTAIEEGITKLDGVNKVQILEKLVPGQTAEPATPKGAPGGAPSMTGKDVPGVKHIIAVASGKGGVGKSTVAVNLAVELARTGARVGLMDSDVYGPSVPKMLGLEGERPQATDQETILPIERFGLKTMSIGFLLE